MVSHKTRKQRGTFVLVFAALIAIFMIALVALQFVRGLGTEQEQRSAIEAASLTAAQDLSRIVINDPNFGYISLSDYTPTGVGTAAGDNFSQSVQSINTVLATNRLDCIIADWFRNPMMQQYADRDYKNALLAKDRLMEELHRVIQPGQSGVDIQGNLISPYDDAVEAYKRNGVRMAGGKSGLVASSLKLSLGYVPGLSTNIHIPKPDGISKVAADAVVGKNYMAFVDQPYKNKHYAFAATNNDTVLVDFSKFQTSINALPYEIPTIVRCDADQSFLTADQPRGAKPQIRHAAAAAQPACLVDSCPHPGILCIDLPGGISSEIQKPSDFLSNTQIIQSPCDLLQTCVSGDAPPGKPIETALFGVEGDHHPRMKDVMAVALYDWIRRGRWHIDVESLTKMFNSSFNSGSAPQSNLYEVQPDGTITYTSKPLPTCTTDAISQNQIYALSGLAIQTAQNEYDLLVYDFCYQPGSKLGGMHAGEPILMNSATQPPQHTKVLNRIAQTSLAKRVFPTGPVSAGPRTTYTEPSIATHIIVTKIPPGTSDR